MSACSGHFRVDGYDNGVTLGGEVAKIGYPAQMWPVTVAGVDQWAGVLGAPLSLK